MCVAPFYRSYYVAVAQSRSRFPHLPTRLRGSKCFCVCVYVCECGCVFLCGCMCLPVSIFVMYGCLCNEYACVFVYRCVCVCVGGVGFCWFVF